MPSGLRLKIVKRPYLRRNKPLASKALSKMEQLSLAAELVSGATTTSAVVAGGALALLHAPASTTTPSSQSRKHSLSQASHSPAKLAKSKPTAAAAAAAVGPKGSPITRYFRPTPPSTPTGPLASPSSSTATGATSADARGPVTPSKLFKLFALAAEIHGGPVASIASRVEAYRRSTSASSNEGSSSNSSRDHSQGSTGSASPPLLTAVAPRVVPTATATFSYAAYRQQQPTASAPRRARSVRAPDAWRTALSRSEVAHLARGGAMRHVASVLETGQKVQALLTALTQRKS